MIKANDLRLGNYLTENGIRFPVNYITEDGLKSILSNSTHVATVTFENPQPIPLTHKLIESIKGCELVNNGKYSAKWDVPAGDNRFIGITHYKVDNTWSVVFGTEIILKQATFHWLQNVVYFNWELSITL